MADYHVGCGLSGIYAGTLRETGIMWQDWSIVTREALSAAAQYLLEQGVYYEFQHGGKKYRLTIIEEE